MARFYMSVKNTHKSRATEVHRLAQTSGRVVAASYDGAIETELYVNEAQQNCARIKRISWHNSQNRDTVIIFDGPLDMSTAYSTDLV